MTEVIIAGLGQTAVGEHWDTSLRELAFKAIEAALRDAGGLRPQALYVGNMLAPNLSRQAHLGVLLADYAGLAGIEAATVEAAGASGGAALHQGYLAVKSGMVDAALVVGMETFTDVIGPDTEAALATVFDSDYEAVQGLTPTAQAALLMRRYMHEFNVPADGFAGFALTAHAHGATNKYAMFQKAIKLETYQKAEAVSEPLNMFDVAPNADGAAAVLLTRRDLLPAGFPHPLVRIAASAAASDTLALHDRTDPLAFYAVRSTVEKSLRLAGINLETIDFFEYHDAFSIYAALSLEASGFAPRGKGWELARDGALSFTGKIPCATFGGLKARGNAGGASGVYQAVEAAIQLRGQGGANQVAGAQYGMIQSLGGPASTAVTHVLTMDDRLCHRL
ncbi:MAG: thiolase domain-containing protein [Anaerolineales bacterium]|nr:thiolase domain-containing protein [Anaerolineales bacterium]